MEVLAADGFALAGSGAIREHGIINRPTENIDLFTSREYAANFTQAVAAVTTAFESHDMIVEAQRVVSEYARLNVTLPDQREISVDLGVDWRADPPVSLDIGPVLSLPDSIGNKVAALYSRGEPRDFLDVDSIRQSGKASVGDLEAAAAQADLGFDRSMFAARLETVVRISQRDVEPYGIASSDLLQIRERFLSWASAIRNPAPQTRRDLLDELDERTTRHNDDETRLDEPPQPKRAHRKRG
ncbi:nucleotidyl transferase AbiEii/AbiGii toxin family protein [Actinomycetaceae bacterium L2_0104]